MNSDLHALDLFAGLGGNHLSLELALATLRPDATVKVDVAVDLNTNAKLVYEANFPSTQFLARDVRDLSPAFCKAANCADVWLMSPPCQPYTRRGSKRDAADRRASGLACILQHLEEGRLRPPPLIFVENVARFEASASAVDLRRVLKRLGYVVLEIVGSPSTTLGVPTARLRVFVIAVRPSSDTSKFLAPPSYRDILRKVEAVVGAAGGAFCPRRGVLSRHNTTPRSEGGGDSQTVEVQGGVTSTASATAVGEGSGGEEDAPAKRSRRSATPCSTSSSRSSSVDVCCGIGDCSFREKDGRVVGGSGVVEVSKDGCSGVACASKGSAINDCVEDIGGCCCGMVTLKQGLWRAVGEGGSPQASPPSRSPSRYEPRHPLGSKYDPSLGGYVGVVREEQSIYTDCRVPPQLAVSGAFSAHIVGSCNRTCVCATTLAATAPGGEPLSPPVGPMANSLTAAGGGGGGAVSAARAARVYAVDSFCSARSMCVTKAYGKYAAGATLLATRGDAASVEAAYTTLSETVSVVEGGAAGGDVKGEPLKAAEAARHYLTDGAGLRWLTPREVALLLDFPSDYILAPEVRPVSSKGRKGDAGRGSLTVRQQWALLGNSVHVGLGAEVLAIGLMLAFS